MRRMHTWRRGGVAAAVGAAALVAPLLAIQPAQAVGSADLSISKLVSVAKPGTIIDQAQFIPAIADMRGDAEATAVDDGLYVRTTSASDKSAQYFSVLQDLPTSVSMDWVQDEGTFRPGLQIVFDADDTITGPNDWNILVGEPTAYGDNWWLTNGSSQYARNRAPHTGGGQGSPYYGTLAEWIAALPNAQMYATGFSLGSGASGINSGTIRSMSVDGTRYDFGTFSSSIKARPGATLEYKLTVTNSGSATSEANDVVVADTLPDDLTYVQNSLVDNGNGCSFSGQSLTCAAGTFPANTSTVIKFKAVLSNDVTSDGLPITIGHDVDVQKQEVFADLPSGQTRTYQAFCPAGYIPTDGGLLIDAVDQGGYYSDIVVDSSTDVIQSGIRGWSVTATNLGDERGQGKVKVTCLSSTTGSSNSHTHTLVVTASTGSGSLSGAFPSSGETVTRTCPSGYTPVTPTYAVTNGVAVVRGSYAQGSSWKWVVDYDDSDTAATFDVDCLAPETSSTNGHTAPLSLTTPEGSVSVDPEGRTEGVVLCPSSARAITGGYLGGDASVLSLGREQRGTNYMFRFYNDDWEQAWNASIQTTCVGVRTADEPSYYHVKNTATVTTSSSDLSTSDNTSTADVAIDGDPVNPIGGVLVDDEGTRTRSGGHTKYVVLGVTCTSACSFTVKVIKGGDVVAKATKSLSASPNMRFISVRTTSRGKDLGAGTVKVRIKSSSGNSTTTVSLS